MKPNFRHLIAAMIVLICGLFGWWLARDLRTSVRPRVHAVSSPEVRPEVSQSAMHRPRQSARSEFSDGTAVEIFGSRKPDEVILRFPSDAAYEAFLIAAGQSMLEIVDQLDRLRAVRLRCDDRGDLSLLLLGENITTYDSIPSVPAPGPVANNQEGLVGFGNGLLPWLGITSDHSSWGTGVKIAVLDSGIVPHTALPHLMKSIEIVPFPLDLEKTHGHGTAVASLIAGSDPGSPGVAPGAELISIRISDETGQADSFAMAAGILAAVDAGADLINISMGTSVDNPLIAEAVLFARDHRSLIVASSGNSEQSDATYPAAYPSVISVGAVDARGEHLDFSNYGSYLSITAPGYAVNAAWPGNRYKRISGTSASAPIVTGAIAATMSNGSGVKMSASQAAEIVMKYSDEAGISGPDSEYGSGILNLGRIMRRGVPGIVDAAITDQRIVATAAGGQIQVTIQNRGTAVLVNTLLEISTPFGNRQFNATTLAPGEIQTFTMPIRLNVQPAGQSVEVNSKLTLGTRGRDITPYNNQRSDPLYFR